MGTDAKTDLAVIKIEEENLTPAQFGDSDKLVTGETVEAIGNRRRPGHAGSVTQGIVRRPTVVFYQQRFGLYPALHPDRCGYQSGQLRRRTGEHLRAGHRHQFLQITATGLRIGFSITINDAKPIIDDLDCQWLCHNRVKSA